MKKSFKLKKIVILTVCFILTFTVLSDAHSGRTDGNGGHRDNQNKSGLGYYHYHHGYEAHLHPNGVCPYSTVVQPSKKVPSSNNSTLTTSVVKEDNKKVYHIATLPEFDIQLNNTQIENNNSKYPFIFYKNIVYIPLTWDLISSLGFDISSDSEGNITIKKNENKVEFKDTIDEKNENEFNVENLDKNIYFDGTVISDAAYPNLRYRDIAYIPLTWNNCNNILNLNIEVEDSIILKIDKKK